MIVGKGGQGVRRKGEEGKGRGMEMMGMMEGKTQIWTGRGRGRGEG